MLVSYTHKIKLHENHVIGMSVVRKFRRVAPPVQTVAGRKADVQFNIKNLR